MVKYRDTSRYDGQKGWFLPDDFLEWEEHPGEAATRVLRDQAGIEDAPVRLATVESFGNGAWHMVFHFVAEVTDPAQVTPGSNVATAEWFDLEQLPDASEVAHHGWALDVLGQVLAGRS
jgi:ADP-ribose pyrophosphatase YjhB (NUDIX family)